RSSAWQPHRRHARRRRSRTLYTPMASRPGTSAACGTSRWSSARSPPRWRALAWCWGMITRPMHAWLIHFAALWIWHAPALFQAGLVDNDIHALQHASFLFSALLFWWAVLGRHGIHHSRGASIVYLFTTMMHTGALGALFTMSETVWYPLYGDRPALFGLTPLEDQQLGGLIMWIPGGLAYVIAGLVLGARWLMPDERKMAGIIHRRPP
ncbi:MAG: cytochrome c oxidase assembly protein, partial [Oxalobacteraceae bacterium]